MWQYFSVDLINVNDKVICEFVCCHSIMAGMLYNKMYNFLYITLSGFGSVPPFPQIDIIRAVVIVWRVRGKLSGLFCAILCATIVHSAMHTHMNRLTVLWIGFCLTGPISLC